VVSRMSLSRLSFRWQITLLGALAAVLLVAVLFAGLAASRYTKSSVLTSERRSLLDTANELAREYSSRDLAGDSHATSLLKNPLADSSRERLTQISHAVLQKLDTVEGGFYAAADDSLVGISYSSDMTARESQERSVPNQEEDAILKVVGLVGTTHQPAGQTFTGVANVVLIEAVPIFDGHDYAGSAWTMKRFSTLPGENRFRTYLIAVGLGLAALACVLLTLLVVRNLQNGVLKIEGGLEALEQNLSSQILTSTDPDEIRQIARAINRLGTTLKEKIEKEKQIEDQLRHSERLAALGRLIAGVAHEVRNPLATIRLRVQMCQGSDNLDVRKSCAIALEEIQRLNDMVNRLLSFSRPVRLNTEPTDLDHLVEQRLEHFLEAAHQHDIRFVTKFSPGPAAIPLDQSRIAQVFDNVIQNAIDAMSDTGGTLCVNVRREASSLGNSHEAYVEFNDTGEGISADILGRIFDPFFTTKASGTGLGLSICHELIQAHGGEIQIVSAKGLGTTVRIMLPAINMQTPGQLV
jgi:signal transduction histidine kinase